jgi:RND family efflux transporter MFP subunit
MFYLSSPGLALVVVIAGLISACTPPEPQGTNSIRVLPAMKVGDATEISRRNFPGRANAAKEVELSFRVNGPLITFPVSVGDKVAQGDVLARIDPRDFEVQQRNVEGQLQRSEANRERSENEYNRLIGIQKKDAKLVSEVSVDRAKEDFAIARADIAALSATLDSAKDSLSYTYLKAPYDGTIVATYVENFEHVRSNQAVVRMLDNRRIEFVFSVPETLISYIPLVANLRVRFDAFPEVDIPAELKEMGTEASLTTRTYPVRLIMDQPDGMEILSGMAGKAYGEVVTAAASSAETVVPTSAVFSTGADNQSKVWVIDESTGRVSSQPVQLGKLVATGVVVLDGLQSGEVIATAGVNYLSEGQEVKPNIQ